MDRQVLDQVSVSRIGVVLGQSGFNSTTVIDMISHDLQDLDGWILDQPLSYNIPMIRRCFDVIKRNLCKITVPVDQIECHQLIFYIFQTIFYSNRSC